jgi:reductive dehalogenase
MNQESYSKVLTGAYPLGPYPMEKLRRVDEPTTAIVGPIERFDERETGFNRASRGDYGIRSQDRSRSGYPVSGAIASNYAGFAAADGGAPLAGRPEGIAPPYPLPDDPGVLGRHIKGFGYFMGADVVGTCRIPQYAVYSHDKAGNPVENDHPNAVTIVVDQGYATMDASTGSDWISSAQSHRAYTTSAFIAFAVAAYIRQLGHAARVHYSRDYQLVLPPLLLLAGVGEIARNGIVLNPFLGLRFKAAVVSTDMPLEADKPVDFGLQDFCRKCKKCAVECPAQAISYDDDKSIYNGYEKYPFHVERCTRFRLTNPHGSMCGRCIKACPWNKPEGWTHDLVRWTIQRAPVLNGLFVRADDLFGYGKANRDRQWWFDPEE